MSNKIPDITQDFSEWYNNIIYAAELADQSPVRGCIVIRPYGYALWEHIKDVLDKKIKDTGHQNASFPLLIPMSFITKEAQHVEGFAPELAVVTHAGGKPLEEPYVVRPTSETIIHYMFAQWIKSYRDLPLKINQWANVMRWEMRTRPFLRTSEFFWQEGHTAHETQQEAHEEALLMLNEYKDMYETYLAIPVVTGIKSEHEKFAGADKTYTIEGMMPDGKALQMCTSHLISQNFAKSFGIMFQSREGKQEYPFLTSWGFTTRSIGALVMVHGDQKGIVMPPRVAPIQVVIIPIIKKAEERLHILNAVEEIRTQLAKANIRVHIDADEHVTPGAKFYKWELKGVPVRIDLGPRDLAQATVMVADRLGLAKEVIPVAQIVQAVTGRLNLIHEALFKKASENLATHIHTMDKLAESSAVLESQGGFYKAGWCGNYICEEQLKQYKASIRCLQETREHKECFACNMPAVTDILLAKSY